MRMAALEWLCRSTVRRAVHPIAACLRCREVLCKLQLALRYMDQMLSSLLP